MLFFRRAKTSDVKEIASAQRPRHDRGNAYRQPLLSEYYSPQSDFAHKLLFFSYLNYRTFLQAML